MLRGVFRLVNVIEHRDAAAVAPSAVAGSAIGSPSGERTFRRLLWLVGCLQPILGAWGDEKLEDEMDTRKKLEVTGVTIGRALGKTRRTARWVAEAARVATEELQQLSKQIEAMADQLKNSGERLKRTLR